MSNINSQGLSFGDTLPPVGFDQLMETENPEDRMLKELVDSVDDESDAALEEFGFEEFIPFAIPQEVKASSVQSSGLTTHSSNCNMPDRIQKVAIVSGDLDFVDRFSDAHMKMSPFHGNLVDSDILEAQLAGSREVSLNDENHFSKSSGLANGQVETSSLALNPGNIAGPHGGTKRQNAVVQLSYSDLYVLCQKQKRDLNKKELGILKMKKLLIEEQQLIVNIRRKRDEAVLDVNRCKEEYCKLDVTHKELLKDYEKMKSEVTSGKLIVQQLGAKISHLSGENKSLQVQIKNNCDPEKIKLKDEVKELSKLVKRNEKIIDSKTDTIQNLRDTLATAQALSEVMKLNINKTSSKGNDLVSAPNSTADVMDQKQGIDLKHMMDEFKAEIYSLIKNVNGAFPAVKTKTKSMFDVSDTEDSETANIRSCTSSIPSYDDDIFEDNFVPSVPSVSPPFSADLLVNTIETEALSLGEYAKTTINFSPQKHDSKNIPSKLNLNNSDYHVFENKNPVVSVPCLVPCISADNNLGNSGNLDKFGNDEIESPCATSGRKSRVEELMATDYRHKYEELPDLTPMTSSIDLEGENKSHSFGDSDSLHLSKVNPFSVKSESTQMSTAANPSGETALASRKNVNLCLSDSDSDDSVPSTTNVSTKNVVLCTVLPDKNNGQNSDCFTDPTKKVQEEKAVGDNCSSLTEDKCDNSPDDYEYYTDSDCSGSESSDDEHSDSISTLSSSEDEREADSTSNFQIRPDPVAESSCASLKDIVSTVPPTSRFSLKDDLNLSSEESNMSDEESDLKGSIYFPKSPSKHQVLNDSKIMDFRPIISLSPQKSVTSGGKNQPAEDKYPDPTLNKNKSLNELVVEISSVSPELTLAIDEKAISSHTKEPCSLVTASPKSSPEENQIVISAKASGDTAAPLEASFGNKPKIGNRKMPSFSRRVVTKASSNSNVEIPGRTRTLPKIFRRQQLPIEIHGIKRSSAPPTTSKDELKRVSCKVGVKTAENKTAYENPAKKIRLSHASQNVATNATTADAGPNKSKSSFFHTVSASSRQNVATLSESSENEEDDKSMDQVVSTVAKSTSIPHPAKTRMSAKDKIKNSMTEIIQVGSGEHMCDKKRMELMAQRQPRVLKPQDKSSSITRRNINPNTTATSEGYDKSKKGLSDTVPAVCKDNVWKSSKIEVGSQPVTEKCAIAKSKETPNPIDSTTLSTDKIKNSLADLTQESSEKTVVYKKRFLKVQTSPKKEIRTQCTPQLNTSTIAKAKDIPSPIETRMIPENKIKNTVEESAPKGRGEALVLKSRFVNVQTLSKTEDSPKSIPKSSTSRLQKLKEILHPKSIRVSTKHKIKNIKNLVAELTPEGTVENSEPEKCVSVVSELPYMEDSSSQSNPELSTDTITTKLKEVPHLIETRMSAKDKIKNSMTDIIQVGSGENMCDKKKLELKAQRTIERLKAEKSSRKDLSSPEPSKSPMTQSSVSDEPSRTKVCEKSAREAFMKSAPVPSVRRLPFLKSGPVPTPQSTITARVTRNSIRAKEKLELEAAIRRSPRKRNHEISSSSDKSSSPIKNSKPKEEICATSASEAVISEKDIFNEMFQELGKNTSNSKSSNQFNGTASAYDVKPELKIAKLCLPPKNMNLLNLIVGRYSRSLKTEEILFKIGKELPQLVENPPTEVFVAHKIYSDLTESIESYLLEKIDEQSLIIGCKKTCSTIRGVKSLLPNLYPTLDIVAVTHFIYQILGKLSYRFDRNDTLHLLGLCYGTICREFSFRDLAFQMLHVVLIKRARQKSCFAQGFISGYPDIWSFPFERGSILERSLVIALTCSPLHCDSLYYKDLRQLFFDGIGLVLPELSFMQFFSHVWNDFKELEFQKSIEEGEKGLAMLLLQCDWRQSIRIIEEHFNSIYKEWNEKKLSDMIFSSFLRVVGWASELTTDPEPQFSTVQAIFSRLKDAHEHDHELTDLLRHSIAAVHEKLGKLAQRGPYNGTELVYYRVSDILEHAKKHDKEDKIERRRVKRKIRRHEKGKAKRKEVLANA